MSIFITAKLESDSESDSEAESKSDAELMAKLKFWFWFCISHFTLNNSYPYIFVDFEQIILLQIAGHIKPVLLMPISFLARHTFC